MDTERITSATDETAGPSGTQDPLMPPPPSEREQSEATPGDWLTPSLLLAHGGGAGVPDGSVAAASSYDGAERRDPEDAAGDGEPASGEPGDAADADALAPVDVVPATPRKGRFHAVLRETLETVLLALLIFVSVRLVVQNFKVEGSSMEPSLHSGQYLLVNKAAYLSLDLGALSNLLPSDPAQGAPMVFPFGAPSRGDVIVFRYPRDPRRDFIKRVIAVAGDTVEVRAGRVLVNGQMLDEPYIVENPAYSKEPTVVPPGNYYVLGDNRNNSSDSHVWGPVPRDLIIGKAWLSYWPANEWGLAPNYSVAAGTTTTPN